MGTVLAWELVARGQYLEPAQGVLGAEGPHWAVVAAAAAAAAVVVVVAVAAAVAAVVAVVAVVVAVPGKSPPLGRQPENATSRECVGLEAGLRF